ncbi:MAG: amidophosphoribosyltransferase [Deltaproteobacteria bacterium]|nr:amidophosphoribosyltransferase [Deltaproteobacteria bacterium]
MGGLFGVVSKGECVTDLFFGTDYHSHLGTHRGGMATLSPEGFNRSIHDISSAPFRSKFQDELSMFTGGSGIGVISDTDDQPLLISSHLGRYAIVTVGTVRNADALAVKAFDKGSHFSEMGGGGFNQTELVAAMINHEASFVDGIRSAQEAVEGSCSMLLLTEEGLYAARDALGRTPVAVGRKDGAYAVTLETSALPNLGFEAGEQLGPAEVVLVTPDGIEQKSPPGERLQICSFLWVYYGYPASTYEGINVETVRNTCGAYLAKEDDVAVDFVAGIPDSGIGHGIGYASESHVPYRRPYVKYTPTWPRSFMPPDQSMRDLVAQMKLIPIKELIQGKKLLFCEDSIVRGTQLQGQIRRLYDAGALEVHMRPACPPLIHGCKFLNFSSSKSELDLAGRRAIKELEGRDGVALEEYADHRTEKYRRMIDRIRSRLALTTLTYQKLDNLVAAIGMPKERLCTFCWDGAE